MPYFPTVPESRQSQIMTGTFLGYNRNPEIGDGQQSGLEFYDTQNLTSDYYPMLASREKRGVVTALTDPGGITAKEHLAYVDNGKLYYNGTEVAGITLTSGDKQLVSMGAYLTIWPDKKYVNTKNLSEKGDIGSVFTSAGSIVYKLYYDAGTSISGGTIYTECTGTLTLGGSEPSTGAWWVDTSTYPARLVHISDGKKVVTPYVRIENTGIGANVNNSDTVNISGVWYSGSDDTIHEMFNDLNGSHTVVKAGSDYVLMPGIIGVKTYTQTGSTLTISRDVPDMDYITESGNRLWGCKYGTVDGVEINEIYASALGDFKRWNQFLGISTDSYAASVGTDGKWTGAVTYMGNPIFFKENIMHKVYPSATGAHQIVDVSCRGVQDGCWKSLAIVGERLFYKARSGVMMYDGSVPEVVSNDLGNVKYSDASAGSIDEKYYISMKDASNNWSMFVLDTKKGFWIREDATNAQSFARFGNDLYYIDADSEKIMTVRGTDGTAESSVHWYAETGLIGYTTVEQKYVSRFNFRMQMPVGSDADLYIQYDSDGIWHHCGHMNGLGTNSFLIPVRPRRCDHFALKLEGHGTIRVYSMSKIYEVGSDAIDKFAATQHF